MRAASDRPYFPKPDNFQPEPVFAAGHRWAGQPRCQAWNKNHGRQCVGRPTRGKRVCWQHGGATPSGIASPHIKHGRYSKALPVGLADTYRLSLADTELVSLRAEIAVLDARTEDLLKRVEAGDSFEVWRRLKAAMSAFDSLNRRASRLDPDDRNRAALLAQSAEELGTIRELISQGLGDWAVWADIKDNLSLRRALADSERRRLVDLQQMLTREQGILLIQSLTTAVLKNVTDRSELAKIQREFVSILSQSSFADASTRNGDEG